MQISQLPQRHWHGISRNFSLGRWFVSYMCKVTRRPTESCLIDWLCMQQFSSTMVCFSLTNKVTSQWEKSKESEQEINRFIFWFLLYYCWIVQLTYYLLLVALCLLQCIKCNRSSEKWHYSHRLKIKAPVWIQLQKVHLKAWHKYMWSQMWCLTQLIASDNIFRQSHLVCLLLQIHFGFDGELGWIRTSLCGQTITTCR